jgi:hypothetical protein
MRRFLISFAILLASISFASQISAQMQWRDGSPDINTPSLVDPRVSDGVEIFSKDGCIIVRSTHRVQVKIFTILGQLVSQATIGPGASTLKINARGIYIVKIGNVTQKVAL